MAYYLPYPAQSCPNYLTLPPNPHPPIRLSIIIYLSIADYLPYPAPCLALPCHALPTLPDLTPKSLSVCQSVSPSIRLSVRPSTHPPTHPSIHLSIHLSIYLSIYLSIHPSIYLWLIIPAGSAYGLGSDHRRRKNIGIFQPGIVLVKYEKSGHHYMSGIYHIGLFVMAVQTGSSG